MNSITLMRIVCLILGSNKHIIVTDVVQHTHSKARLFSLGCRKLLLELEKKIKKTILIYFIFFPSVAGVIEPAEDWPGDGQDDDP